MNTSIFRILISVISILLVSISARSQENSSLQVGMLGGASTPLGDYKNIGNAKSGFVTGIFSDYYFSNFGIGLDARYVHHALDVQDVVSSTNSVTTNTYKSAKRYNHLGIALGPTYQLKSNGFVAELYAKGGIVFQRFPEYLSVTVREAVPGSLPVPLITSREYGQPDKIKSWIALAGLRLNYGLTENLFLFGFGDYQTTLSKQSFWTPNKFYPENPVPVRMLNVGLGIKFLLGEIRDPGSLKINQ